MNTAQSIAPKPAALPPAVPAPAANPASTGPSFAQFLTVQAAPPPAEPKSAAPEAAPASPQRKAAQATPPKPAKPAEPDKATAKSATDTDADAKAVTARDGTEPAEDEASATEGLSEFAQLIGIAPATLPAPPTEAASGRGARGAAAQDDDEPAGRTVGAARGQDDDATAAPGRPADTTARAKAAELRADQAAASRDADATQASAGAAQTQPQATPAETAPPSFAAVLAQALPANAARPDAGPPVTAARLHAPLHSPAFAPEMAGRISLLAVDGVQQAQLQLNPADMGPVSVQIVVDGSQAQVSFHAAQAETRQALEQSLPELAAALQGQGLTLSGGGVFQQSARDNGHTSGEAQANTSAGGNGDARGDDDLARGAAAAPARRSVGLLDTFA